MPEPFQCRRSWQVPERVKVLRTLARENGPRGVAAEIATARFSSGRSGPIED
jgi:uncharacterized protein (DUF2062 family)